MRLFTHQDVRELPCTVRELGSHPDWMDGGVYKVCLFECGLTSAYLFCQPLLGLKRQSQRFSFAYLFCKSLSIAKLHNGD